MTLFAEKLQTLRNPAWAPHYIGCARIDTICADPAPVLALSS